MLYAGNNTAIHFRATSSSGPYKISDAEGYGIMGQLSESNTSAGSDGVVNDGIECQSFCLADNTFTRKIGDMIKQWDIGGK